MPEPNPCLDIVKIYHDLGGEIITVGSDAHEVKFLLTDFDVVADMLKNAGFNYYTIFNERKPEFIRDYDELRLIFIYMYLICTFYIHL